MTVRPKIECPKCHADRTLLDTSFGVPGYLDPPPPNAEAAEPGADAREAHGADSAVVINTGCAVRVRLLLCPRCHYLEMYHDVGLSKPC